MGRRSRVITGVALTLSLIGGAALASAQVAPEPEPTVTGCLQSGMICSGISVPGGQTQVTDDSDSDSGSGHSDSDNGNGDGNGSSEPETCQGESSSGIANYTRVSDEQNEQMGVGGAEPGHWYLKWCGEDDGGSAGFVWIADGEPVGSAPSTPPPPTAAEIRNQTPIGEATIVIDPNELGLCGLLTGFRAEGVTPITSTSSIRGYSVTATATPTSWSWDLGDDTFASGAEVEHVYETRGSYRIELTVTYTGSFEWSGNGRSGSGDLGTISKSSARETYPVIEAKGVLSANY